MSEALEEHIYPGTSTSDVWIRACVVCHVTFEELFWRAKSAKITPKFLIQRDAVLDMDIDQRDIQCNRLDVTGG